MLDVPNSSPESQPQDARRSRDEASSSLHVKRSAHLSRSPHPYRRLGLNPEPAPEGSGAPTFSQFGSLTSSKSEDDSPYQWHRKMSTSPDDSGTEADDESPPFLKRLPAPPLRPRKGLIDAPANGSDLGISPLPTPAIYDGGDNNFAIWSGSTPFKKSEPTVEEEAEAQRLAERLLQRRRAELRRRSVEVLLLAVIGYTILCGDGVWTGVSNRHRALVQVYSVVSACLGCLYVLGLLWPRQAASKPLLKRIRVPSVFDPAPLLYPTLLPIFVALSLCPSQEQLLLPNIILSISSLPPRLIPFQNSPCGRYIVHWAVSTIPFIAREGSESLSILFPLHQALLPVLHYLTTTSLLPTELRLLATALVNLLLNSGSPQSVILKAILWGGGVSTFVLCGRVLQWGVALARIPRWRLRSAANVVLANNAFFRVLQRLVIGDSGRRPAFGSTSRPEDSDADDDDQINGKEVETTDPRQLRRTTRSRNNTISCVQKENGSANVSKNEISKPQQHPESIPASPPRRRNTLPASTVPEVKRPMRPRHRRGHSSSMQSYLRMTPTQAKLRKWLYAAYVYSAVIVIVLVGVRTYIAERALKGRDPFGWALGYLFGDVQDFRMWVVYHNFQDWISLPPRVDDSHFSQHQSLSHLRTMILGEANTRLLVCGYCVGVLATGLWIVFRLSRVVEVDTRRKVFHGMMVAMFLPNIFVDPIFCSLALSVILALFLLLDLFRASQLPPLSVPISHFLAPYVDGRDLRGPVVVSHIFLLIGCAIPLWLSLAAVERTGTGPWDGWEVEKRDISMIAGVVCVGLGDAAASLVGRRIGRHKWFWSGGKSLEGSAAFAVAVAAGLALGKTWGRVGGWLDDLGEAFGLGRMLVAGAGASLMEAVLTGGNDNVIVPVVLWLLVRGLGI